MARPPGGPRQARKRLASFGMMRGEALQAWILYLFMILLFVKEAGINVILQFRVFAKKMFWPNFPLNQ